MRLFEERDERVGLHDAARRVLPAQQRFDAEHATVLEIEDRLVDEKELAPLGRGAEIELEREPVLYRGLHLAHERHVAIAARGLGLVQRDVGVAQQVGRPRCRAPYAMPMLAVMLEDSAGRALDLERLAQHFEQALGDELGTAGRCAAFDEHDEFVTADSGNRVGLAQRRRQPGGDRSEQAVAGVVAERVVHLLEAVEVDEQRRALGVAAAGAGEHLLDAVENERAVREPGERVVQRLVTDALEQPRVSDGDRRLARESSQPFGDVGVVAEALRMILDVGHDEADRIAVDRATGTVATATDPSSSMSREQRASGRRGLAVPHVHGDRRALGSARPERPCSRRRASACSEKPCVATTRPMAAFGSNRMTAERSQPITAVTARAMSAAISSLVAISASAFESSSRARADSAWRRASSTAVAESSAAATRRA